MTAVFTRDAQRDSLLRGVIDNPDDVVARLVYADYLEEFGDDGIDALHAGVIRKSIRHPQEGLTGFEIERSGDGPRCQRLSRVGSMWTPQEKISLFLFATNLLLHSVPSFAGKVIFIRGFFEEVRASFGTLVEHGPAIVTMHPVRRMIATDKEPAYVDHESGFGGWTWGMIGHARHFVPSAIVGPLLLRWHSTDDAAQEALSVALLDYCRVASKGAP